MSGGERLNRGIEVSIVSNAEWPLIFALPEMELYLEKDAAERKEADHSQMQELVPRVSTTANTMLSPPSTVCSSSEGEWRLVASPDDMVVFVEDCTFFLRNRRARGMSTPPSCERSWSCSWKRKRIYKAPWRRQGLPSTSGPSVSDGDVPKAHNRVAMAVLS